jgi:hypothetical protein
MANISTELRKSEGRVLRLTVSILLLTLTAVVQARAAAQERSAEKQVMSSDKGEAMPPLIAPLLIQEERTSNILTLVSNSTTELKAIITVKNASGQTTLTTEQVVAAHSGQRVDISRLLSAAPGTRNNKSFVGYLVVSSMSPILRR